MGKKSKEIYDKFNNYDKMFIGFKKAIFFSLKNEKTLIIEKIGRQKKNGKKSLHFR